MAEELLIEAFETYSLIMVLLSFAVFTWLGVKAKSIGSFRLQLSIFMLTWAVSEIPHIAGTLNLFSTVGYEMVGLTLHLISMAAFSLFIAVRSYGFLRTQPPTISTTTQQPPMPQRTEDGNLDPSQLR